MSREELFQHAQQYDDQVRILALERIVQYLLHRNDISDIDFVEAHKRELESAKRCLEVQRRQTIDPNYPDTREGA